MVSTGNTLDPLLKRPISLHRWLGADFQLLYRVVGKGTSILSAKKPGDILDILGPLGNGFPLKQRQKHVILLAGGLGIAPIFGLAETLISSQKGLNKKNKPLLFYGARTEEEILCLDELKSLGLEPVTTTDDGTAGKKGNIVNALKSHLNRHAFPVTDYIIYACGPGPMLKALSSFTIKKNIKTFVALEQNMACGLGTCLGCAVNTTSGYKRVCKEGPVFPIEEIVWD